jgi:hypothetical protein
MFTSFFLPLPSLILFQAFVWVSLCFCALLYLTVPYISSLCLPFSFQGIFLVRARVESSPRTSFKGRSHRDRKLHRRSLLEEASSRKRCILFVISCHLAVALLTKSSRTISGNIIRRGVSFSAPDPLPDKVPAPSPNGVREVCGAGLKQDPGFLGICFGASWVTVVVGGSFQFEVKVYGGVELSPEGCEYLPLLVFTHWARLGSELKPVPKRPCLLYRRQIH